ncbi:PREDICTED: uncharacterized protein LOC108569843 [Nicrophorus vespilloides]|uniref:Uncharacterized protein LOC108569843 n=1 Tax=Nicrophorus vespilloides TaxID=110193 RepID=A0ABM1NJP0_NICVS|nr:PREDICTED: uncharacterized protein LOC108569843 [Nicrophorus vespilloides]
MREKVCLLLLAVTSVREVICSDYSVVMTSDSPIVTGASISFHAKLYKGNQLAEGNYRYEWIDDAIPRHAGTLDSETGEISWSADFSDKIHYPPGPYVMQLTIYKVYLLYPWMITSQRLIFNLTENLNGNLESYQNQVQVNSNFVSNATTVVHKVSLKKTDQEYLDSTATKVLTYWFIGCDYYGPSDNYEFSRNYTTVDEEYTVGAIVWATFEPIPVTTTPAPTTTTIKPNATTAAPTTTTSVVPNVANVEKTRHRRDLEKDIVGKFRGKYMSLNESTAYNESFPFFCSNNTIIALGPNLTYGVFTTKVSVKQPISNISVTGNNWIRHSDMLQLSVGCRGSSGFKYCYSFRDGVYNVTGNETCDTQNLIEKCQFPINRLFITDNTDVHTVIIIISNEVSKMVYPVTVNVYKATKQAQLSVIVVPVVFSLAAVVLIVFGVAYYFQNRSRFTVEVADFNFGQQYADMEYKTFSERLKDSMSNAFTRASIPGGSFEETVWPPGHKYGSMT